MHQQIHAEWCSCSRCRPLTQARHDTTIGIVLGLAVVVVIAASQHWTAIAAFAARLF